MGWRARPARGESDGKSGLRRPREPLHGPVGQVGPQRDDLARILAAGLHQVDTPITIPVGDEGDGGAVGRPDRDDVLVVVLVARCSLACSILR